MNPGQEQFYTFFIERVLDDKKEEAKALLEDSFAKQAAGTFGMADFQELKPKMMVIVKPEALDEVTVAMNHFASKL